MKKWMPIVFNRMEWMLTGVVLRGLIIGIKDVNEFAAILFVFFILEMIKSIVLKVIGFYESD